MLYFDENENKANNSFEEEPSSPMFNLEDEKQQIAQEILFDVVELVLVSATENEEMAFASMFEKRVDSRKTSEN